MICFKKDIAIRYGVNAAVVICIIDEILHDYGSKSLKLIAGVAWARCPISMLTGICPFFTRSMAESAIQVLIGEGLLLKRKLSDNPFDNANWYSITTKGQLMLRDEII